MENQERIKRKKEIWEELEENCDIKTILLISELTEIDKLFYTRLLKEIKKDTLR